MVKTKKKWLAMMMAVVMMVGSLGAGFAITPDYTEPLFNTMKTNYIDKFYSSTQQQNASRLYVLLNLLHSNGSTIESAVESALAAVPSEKMTHLQNYGLDQKDNLIMIYNAFKSELPGTIGEFTSGSNLFAALYQDTTPTYDEHGQAILDMGLRIIANSPEAFKTKLNAMAPDVNDKAKLLQLLLLGFHDSTDKSYLGKGIKSTELSNNVVTYTLNFDSTLINTVKIKASVGNTVDGFDPVMSDSFVEAYMTAVSVVLDSVESLINNNNDAKIATIELLRTLSLIQYEEKTTGTAPVTPPIGGGGVPIIPPVVPPTEPGNPETPVGTPNPDVIYTSLAMREATQLINSPSVTPAQATPVLEALAKEVLSGSQDIVETQQIVERAVVLFEKLLENPALTNADAIAMAEMVLSQFVAPAMVKDTIGATDPALKVIAADLMTELLEKVGTIPSSGVITLAMAQTAAKAQDDALETMKDALNAIFSNLEQSRLAQNLMITAPATSVRVEVDAVAFMKANDLGLTVKSGSAMITLPTALVDGLTSGLSLMVDLSPKSSAGLGLKLQNGNASSAPVVYDISLYLINAQNEVAEVLTNIQPLVSLPIGNLTANLHTVGAYYYNETSQVWEYVRSTISGNRMVFLAPHLSTYGVLQRSMVFSDMMTHWAKNVVEELAVKNIISGRAPELYVPNGTITRAEFATLLVQTLQLEGDIKVTFADVDINDWYYQYVNVAALHGLVSGVGDGKFNPNANITRQDMAIMIVKAYEKMLGTPVKSVAVDIKDLSDVSQYAKDRVLAARFNRLIGGYPDGTFKPLANATRAEAAQMIRNLLEK